MVTLIEFKEIPIFRFLDAEGRLRLGQIFQSCVRIQGEEILSHGKPVPGLYVIVEGEVAAIAPQTQQVLALLGRGQSFGEMSLIEQTESASAHILVQSSEVKLMFCPAEAFKQLLLELPNLSHAFFKGASLLLSNRLRHLNGRINEELAEGLGLVTRLIRESEVSQQLTVTRSEVSQTGDTVVSKLMTIMPMIDTLTKTYPTAKGEFECLRQKIEDIFLVDAQNFDRIAQQLELIVQHFENLKRVANGGQPKPIVGDKSLFRRAS